MAAPAVLSALAHQRASRTVRQRIGRRDSDSLHLVTGFDQTPMEPTQVALQKVARFRRVRDQLDPEPGVTGYDANLDRAEPFRLKTHPDARPPGVQHVLDPLQHLRDLRCGGRRNGFRWSSPNVLGWRRSGVGQRCS